MDKYFILMGDIENSRDKNSDILWNNLNSVIIEANKKFAKSRLSLLGIKIGDEFQVVMKDVLSLLNLMYYLDVAFLKYDIHCRFAIGYGHIKGDLNKESIFNLMGSGLTYTNELLNNKSNKNKYRFYVEDDIEKEISLNIIGILLESLNKKMTKKRIEFLNLKVVEQLEDIDIEQRLDTKSRNIYRYKEESLYNLHQEIFKKINFLFNTKNKTLMKSYLNDFNLPALEMRKI